VAIGLAIGACLIAFLALAWTMVSGNQTNELRREHDDTERRVFDLERAWAQENPEPWTWPARERPHLYDVERDEGGVPLE
jgi:hypothetical protein